MAQPAFAAGGSVTLPGGLRYRVSRLTIIAVGVTIAVGLYFLITRTRLGMPYPRR